MEPIDRCRPIEQSGFDGRLRQAADAPIRLLPLHMPPQHENRAGFFEPLHNYSPIDRRHQTRRNCGSMELSIRRTEPSRKQKNEHDSR